MLSGAAIMALTGLSATAGASTVARPNAKAPKADLAYFAGKTIAFISPGSVGGSTDLFVRTLAPLMASYLHCTVNVQDFSSQVVGQNAAAAAVPNGLTIGVLQINSDLDSDVSNIPGLNFSIQKEEIIAATPTNDGIIAAKPTFSVRTFKELVHAKSPVPFADETPGGTDLEARLLFSAYNVKVRFVTGYTSNASVASGFERGDAPAVINGYTTLQPLIASGQATVIIQTNALVKGASGYAMMKKFPTVISYAHANPPPTALGKAAIAELIKIVAGPNMTVTAPTGTPLPIVTALTDAVHYALSQPSAHASLLASGINPVYISPQEASKDIGYVFKHQSVIVQELGRGY